MTSVSEFVLNYVVNASWQATAIVIVAAAAASLLRNGPARYRHALWFAVLALSITVPLLAAPRAIRAEKSVFNSAPANTTTSAAADQPVTYLTRRRVQVVSTTSTTTLWFMLAYGLLVAWRVIRLVRFWVGKERLRRSAIKHGLASGVAQVAQRCSSILKTRDVVVARSDQSRVPCTIGARRPLIVLPEVFCVEDEDRLLAVIGHEMAHVARRDYVSNLITEILAVPLAFHPLTYFIKRQIDRERELACDELVSQRLLSPKLYARSLVWAADVSSRARSQALLLSMFDARSLEDRLMRLTRSRRMPGLRAARLMASAAMLALLAATMTLSLFSFELKSQARAAFSEVLPRIENPPATTIAQTTTAPTTATIATISAGQSRAERSLNESTAQARAEAACDTGRRGDVDKIPTLVAMLADDRNTELLHCWNNGRWSPALETFKHPSPGEQAALALASLGPPAFQPLTNQLDNADATVRRNAAWAIGELTRMPRGERDSAVPQLITLLNDSDEWVRMAAARALGELRNHTAVPKLIATLADSEWRVRELAVWALTELKDDRAVAALCTVLLSDARVEVRRSAAEALGEIRSAAALPSLKQALNDAAVSARAKWAIDEIEG